MNPSPVKQLIALIGQAGGLISIPLSSLSEAGVMVSMENIGDEQQSRLVLRLGPRIYYVPQAQAQPEVEEVREWPNEKATTAMTELVQQASRHSKTSSPQIDQPDPVAEEMEAIQSLTNRPRPKPQTQPARQRVAKAVEKRLARAAIPLDQVREEDQPFPYPKPGVHRLSEIELWFRETAANEAHKIRDKQRNQARDLRDGDLPFRTIPGR